MLTRPSFATNVGPAWVEVSTARPCPCCGADSACSVGEDDDVVRCRRTVSQHPMLGGGWLHVVGSLLHGTLAEASEPVVEVA
jgi:hypothetical protein